MRAVNSLLMVEVSRSVRAVATPYNTHPHSHTELPAYTYTALYWVLQTFTHIQYTLLLLYYSGTFLKSGRKRSPFWEVASLYSHVSVFKVFAFHFAFLPYLCMIHDSQIHTLFVPVDETSPISARAATVLATTMGVESDRRSLRRSRNPWSSTNWALMSWSFATHTAAVFLT